MLGHDSLFSYVGPPPDFLPYFLGLLAWAGMALAGILAWPISAVIGRFRRAGGHGAPQRKNQLPITNLPESADETYANRTA